MLWPAQPHSVTSSIQLAFNAAKTQVLTTGLLPRSKQAAGVGVERPCMWITLHAKRALDIKAWGQLNVHQFQTGPAAPNIKL